MAYDPLYLIFFILALIYVTLSIFAIIRGLKLYNFSSVSIHTKLFYFTVICVCVLRSFAFLFIFVEQVRNLSSFFLLLSVPDAVFTLSYIMLFWQFIIVFSRAHMDDLVRTRLLRTEGKQSKSKLLPVIFGVLIAWSLLQVAFYCSYVLNMVSSGRISDEIGIANLIFPTLALLITLIQHIRYAGSPIKSPAWLSKVAKVRFVTLIWSLGRYVRGVLSLVTAVTDHTLSRQVVNDTSNVSFSQISALIAYLICCEVICVLLVLDYGFVVLFAFAQDDVGESGEVSGVSASESRVEDGINGVNPRFSMVANSSLVLADDVVVGEEYRSRKNGLGKMFIGKCYGHDVIIRKITFPRISGYVMEEFEAEIASLKSVSHPLLLPTHAANIHLPEVQIITPYVPCGSLFDLLHVQKRALTMEEKLKICLEVARGMSAVYQLGRKHGHLTSHNILIDHDLTPYITDLGLFKLKKYAGILINYSNKSSWSSPELLRENCPTALHITESDDMYSYGVVVWEILTEQEPFPNVGRARLMQMVARDSLRPEIPQSVDGRLSELIKSCWNTDPSRRPSFSLLLSPLESLSSLILTA